MKKEFRLKKSTEIEKVVKTRNSVGNKYFVILKKNNKEKNHRIAISVSKKFGNAVCRNKVKRQVREIIRDIKFLNNLDILIVIKPVVKEIKYDEIKKHILYLIKKHKIKGV